MPSAVDAMATLLVRQLRRLDALDASDPERIAAECLRAKAVNDTVKGVVALGELHLKAEVARDAAEVAGAFNGGALFSALPAAKGAGKPDFGGRTKVNGLGEFEVDEEDGYGREIGA